MDVIAYKKTGLIGGTVSDLDSIDGDTLNNDDFAFVMTADKFYAYALNATSGAAESSPDIIAPNTNAGDKRWILQPWLSGTTARYGLLKLATVAMAIAGTDTATAITPEGLTSRLAAPGEIGGSTPGDGYFSDVVKINDGTISRDVNDYIETVSITDGRTLTLTRDVNGYIQSITDTIRTWTLTRDVDNRITAWGVA